MPWLVVMSMHIWLCEYVEVSSYDSYIHVIVWLSVYIICIFMNLFTWTYMCLDSYVSIWLWLCTYDKGS